MRDLIVFYTWKGNTEVVAREIAEVVGGDICKIEEVKPIKSFMGAAFSALIGRKSRLKPLGVSPSDYDRIFIGGQVWASRTSPAINSFLENTDFSGKKVYLFITQADGNLPTAVLDSMENRVEKKGGQVKGRFFIQTVMGSVISQEEVRPRVADWVNKTVY